jgi:guanine deaminase
MKTLHEQFLKRAIEKAKESAKQGGFPAGAIVVKNRQIIGEGISIGNILNDSTSHGEMAALRDACKNLSTSDLSGVTLYASMQPCVMCFGAAMWRGISEIIYACSMKQVSPEYYGGHINTAALSQQLLQPIKLTYCPELSAESLAIVEQWELSLK